MSYVQAPFLKEAFRSHGDSFLRCVSKAGHRFGIADPKVMVLFSYFLEALAVELDHGNAVVIRDFGTFKPTTWNSKKPGLAPFCKVYFHPSESLSKTVKLSAPRREDVAKVVKRYRKRHALSDRKTKANQTVFTAMAALRALVRKY